MDPKKEQALIKIVKDMNSGYANKTEPTISRAPIEIGNVTIHRLGFRGGDEEWYENYVTEYKNDLRGFKRIEDAVPEILKGVGVWNYVMSNFRIFAFSVLALVLVATLCGLAITGKVNVEVITSLATLVIGYLAGKVDHSSTAS